MGESELRGELSASSLALEPFKGLSGPSEREEVKSNRCQLHIWRCGTDVL